MSEIVNLRQARKRRDRAERDAQAEANRLQHGRTKAEKTLTAAQRAQDARKLEAHRLEADASPRQDD